MRPTAYIFSMFPHSVVPYINPANQAPGIQTGPSQGIKHFNRLIMGKNLKPRSQQLICLVCSNV